MEVTVPTTLNVLNGSDARLACTFNSCYTVNHKHFSLNWTYQECSNCSEEMVSLVGGEPLPCLDRTWGRLLGRKVCCPAGPGEGWRSGGKGLSPRHPQFLQFRMKIINLKLERFRDRVEFSGNPSKYDVSVTLRNVQPEDEGLYSCYILNPPDRHRGHGRIQLRVLMEGERRGRGAAGPWLVLAVTLTCCPGEAPGRLSCGRRAGEPQLRVVPAPALFPPVLRDLGA